MISLLQNQASGNGGAADGAAAAAMPPPAPVGLFQTPSSAGPTAARSPVPEGETPFSSIRQYLQKTNAERRRVPLSLPNARGAMRPGASVGLGSGSRPALGGAPSTGFRSLYAASDAPQQPSLLGMNGPRGAGGFGTTRGVGYGGPGSPPTASGTGMDWRSPGAGKGLLSPGMKRSRDMAEFDLHERESGRSTVQRVFGPGEVAGTPAVPAVPKATPAKASTGGKEPAASAVTTDTARRILQTLDRLAGQKPGSDADAVIASPAAKPLNLSSSLNKAAAPTSSLHGFRGIQRATPAKSLASAEKRSPASFIASHSKPIASAPKPSPLQFQPEAFKEQEKPSTVAPAPAVSPSTFAPGSSKSSHGVEAKANKPPPPLFSSATAAKPASSPVPATSTESLPTFSFGGSPMANLRRHLFRPLQQTSFRPTPSEVMMTICQSITSARKMTARSMRSSLVLEIWTRRLSLSSTPSAKASQRPSSTLCPLSRQWKRVPDRLSLSGPPRPSLHRHPRLRVPSHQYLNLWLLRRRLSSWRSLTTRRSPSPKSTCGERIS